MNSKQQILQQEKERTEQLIAQADSALDGWEAASRAWEVEQTEAAGNALEAAMKAYHDATGALAVHMSSLYKSGYRITIGE